MNWGSAFELGASGIPYIALPPVCVADVIGALAVWQQNQNQKEQKIISKIIRVVPSPN